MIEINECKTFLDTYYFLPFSAKIPDELLSRFETEKKNYNIYNRNKKRSFMRDYSKTLPLFIEIKEKIKDLYDSGYGYKAIAKMLGTNGMICRHLLNDYLQIETRKGMNCVPDSLKERRKVNNRRLFEESRGWYKKGIIRNTEYTQRGVQGRYFNKSKNKEVWLRSAYEFIYAEWLDYNNFNWDSEYDRFKLENGEHYIPDFFIFDDDGNITELIEIKGYWKTRSYKTEMLKDVIDPSIKITLLTYENETIDDYIIENINSKESFKNYNCKLKQWKTLNPREQK